MIRRWAFPFLLLAFGLFYLLPLATHGLWVPDESRYAQISQEMLLKGDWIAPHFMGIRYFEKPVAGYWVIALGQALFGDNLFGVRIASALSTGLSVLLAHLITRRLWDDPRKSLAAALLYMSFGLIAGQAGYSNLDPQFTLWVNLSLVALWFAVDSRTLQARLGAWIVLGLASGIGFMTKGFLAWLLPVLIAVPYMFWQRRLGELLRYGPIAVITTALVSLPWVLSIHGHEPDFWRFFFWHEHIRRFAADNAQHIRPWWFYLPLMLVSCLPWSLLIPSALVQAWGNKRQPGTGFLLLWLLLPLALFSLCRGKLPTYIMPCLLPLAVLMASTLMDQVSAARTRVLRINATLNLLIGLAGLITLIYLKVSRALYGHDEMLSFSLVFIMFMGWILVNLLAISRPLSLWAAPALGGWLLVALLPAGMPASVVHDKMPDQFIQQHLNELQQSTSLLSNDLGAASALAWRTQRPEVMLYDSIGELKYGIAYPDSSLRAVGLDRIESWMTDALKKGSVGVVMRVRNVEDNTEVALLPPGGKRYTQGNMLILIYPQSPLETPVP